MCDAEISFLYIQFSSWISSVFAVIFFFFVFVSSCINLVSTEFSIAECTDGICIL